MIESQPQGDNQAFQPTRAATARVTQDNASNGGFHIRNEHGNVQYRINGVQIPDGISGFNQFLDPPSRQRLSPHGRPAAQYGLHTAASLTSSPVPGRSTVSV